MGRTRGPSSLLARSSPQFSTVKRGASNMSSFPPILPKNESPTPSDLGYSSPTQHVPQDAMLMSPPSLLHHSQSLVSAMTPSVASCMADLPSSSMTANAKSVVNAGFHSSIEKTFQNNYKQNSLNALIGFNCSPAHLLLALRPHPISNQYSFLSLSQALAKQNSDNIAQENNESENSIRAIAASDISTSLGLYHSTAASDVIARLSAPNDQLYNRSLEDDDDDDDREPGELVIKEDPNEDEDMDVVENHNNSFHSDDDSKRSAPSAIASIFNPSTGSDRIYSNAADANFRAVLDRFNNERVFPSLSPSSVVNSPMLSHSHPPSISSLHSLLDSVNSNITRHQYEQTMIEANANVSGLLSRSHIASDLRCRFCNIVFGSHQEALNHAVKLCPFIPQISDAQEDFQSSLINRLSSKLQKIASSTSHYQFQQQQHLQQQRNFSSRGSSSYRDEESGSDADVGSINGQMALDLEENSRDGRKVRSRSHIRGEHLDVLRPLYLQNPRPKKEDIIAIADKLNFPARVVQVWFQNARARDRREGRPIPSQSSSSISASFANAIQNVGSSTYSNSLLNFRRYDITGIVSNNNNNNNSSFNGKSIGMNMNSSDVTTPANTSVSPPASSASTSSIMSSLHSLGANSSLYPSNKSFSEQNEPHLDHLEYQQTRTSLCNIQSGISRATTYECSTVHNESDQDSMPLDLSTKRPPSPVMQAKNSEPSTPVCSPTPPQETLPPARRSTSPLSPIKCLSPSNAAHQTSEPVCLTTLYKIECPSEPVISVGSSSLSSPRSPVASSACSSPISSTSAVSISVTPVHREGLTQTSSASYESQSVSLKCLTSTNGFTKTTQLSPSSSGYNGCSLTPASVRSLLSSSGVSTSTSSGKTTGTSNSSDQTSKLAQILQGAKLGMSSSLYTADTYDFSEKRQRVRNKFTYLVVTYN